MWRRRVAAALLIFASAAPVRATSGERLAFPLRGQTLTLTVYRPANPIRGTIIMGSGDAGWIGLAVSMAEFLADQHYLVVGVNVRQYLASFTAGSSHVTVADVPADYRTLSEFLRRSSLLVGPTVLSGVSEGAALSILAAADPGNHAWINAVVTMGLPPTAELGWRWTDLGAWVMKRNLDEPSFAPEAFIAGVAPLPLAMLQSAKDEYATDADRARLLAAARQPKKMILIDASNHRFTDRRDALRREFLAALDWTRGPAGHE